MYHRTLINMLPTEIRKSTIRLRDCSKYTVKEPSHSSSRQGTQTHASARMYYILIYNVTKLSLSGCNIDEESSSIV